MSALEWITQSVPALTSAVATSTIYDFMKYLLKKTRERDYYADRLKKTFKEVAEEFEPAFWVSATGLERIRFQENLVECLQSPDVDRDKFISVLESQGVSHESAKRIYRKVFEEFKSIVDKEAPNRPKVFMEIMLHAAKKQGRQMQQITHDIQALREEIPCIVSLLSETNKAQLDRIESKVEEISKVDVQILPTIQCVLRKDEISEGEFFRKEPAWIDFEEGFVAERVEVKAIINSLESRSLHMVTGPSGSGKSVVLKNVGYKLAKQNLRVFYLELKKYPRRRFDQIANTLEGSFILIVDDAHLQLSDCESLVRHFRAIAPRAKLLVGFKSTEGRTSRSAKETSEFDYLTKTELSATSAFDSVVSTYLRKRHGFSEEKILKAKGEFSDYSYDLWYLAWALMSFNSETDTIRLKEIYEKIRDTIRSMGLGAADILLPLSVFYRFELPVTRAFMQDELFLDAMQIDRLVQLSEIIQTEPFRKGRSLSLVHSSIAELYFETFRHFPDLGENTKKMINKDDIEFELFRLYLNASEMLNAFDILTFLWDRRNGFVLLSRLFQSERSKASFMRRVAKEKDLTRINELLRPIRFPPLGLQIARKFEEISTRMRIVQELGPRPIGQDFSKQMREIDERVKKDPSTLRYNELDRISKRLTLSLFGSEFFEHISKKTVLDADAEDLRIFLRIVAVDLKRPESANRILSLLTDIDLAQKMRAENLLKVLSYIQEISKLSRRRGSFLISSNILLEKLRMEEDFVKLLQCLSEIIWLNEESGLSVAQQIDFSRFDLRSLKNVDVDQYSKLFVNSELDMHPLHPKITDLLNEAFTRYAMNSSSAPSARSNESRE